MTEAPPRLVAALADRYVLERTLGQGGMATVYLAEDLRHHRKVAIKVLRADLAATMGATRFLREIEIAAQLQHPHILPLLDSGEADGFLCYVMPFVTGQSLRERLEREGELPVPQAIRLLAEVSDALMHAHEHGVVHRDIKPDNIMLSGRHALVTDFGVAKAISDATNVHTLTTTGMAVGTPTYMSPEQAAADPHIDHRSDLYAVGVVAYEILTGRPPFTGSTPQQILAAQVTEVPDSVTKRRPGISPDLDAIVARCLAKRPADRFQSAAELLAQLEPLAALAGAGAPTEVRSASTGVRSTARRLAVIGGALVVVVVGAVLFGRAHRGGAPEVRVGRRVQATLASGIEAYPSLSPDGSLLAYTAGTESRLFVRQVDAGNPIAVAHGLAGIQRAPFWSGDGKQLSFTSERGLEIVPALGGIPHLLVPGAVFGGSWSPDGHEVLVARADSLYAAPADGGPLRLIARFFEPHSCTWGPGKWIACVSGNRTSILPGINFGNLAPSSVVVVASTGGDPIKVAADSSSNTSPAWLPDGALMFVSSRDGGRDVYVTTLNGGAAAATPRRVTTGLNALSITLSASGTKLGYAEFHETSNIWSLPMPAHQAASLTQATSVTTGNQIIERFDISRDGRWLLFDSDRQGTSHLYRMPLDGGTEEQLTFGAVDEFWPNWSPDGTEIAFHSFRDGHRQLYLMPATGGKPVEIAHTNQDDRTPTWTPDGRSMLFVRSMNTAASEIRMIPRTSGNGWGESKQWRHPSCNPVFSPDGSQVTCLVDSGYVVLDARGVALRFFRDQSPLEHGSNYSDWSADGKTIFYVDSVGSAVRALPAGGGPTWIALPFTDPSRPWHRFGFRTFRGRFYLTLGDRQSDIWIASLEKK